jgi:RNA polymerase sigma-70 factor, ECF subfamily
MIAEPPQEYATIIIDGARTLQVHASSSMLLIALVVRSTIQKRKASSPPAEGQERSCPMAAHTAKMATVACMERTSEYSSYSEGLRRMIRVETEDSPWSFEEIYDAYKTPIYNHVYHLVGDREQADDLTQDTFLKAFRALPRMDANLRLSAWLYRIATNTAYDALRRRRLIVWLPWQDLDYEPADVDSADPQEIYGTTELVRAALRRMPRQYRLALLYTQEGFSYCEIARRLDIAQGGVKMYLSRARQSFREHYRILEQSVSAR